MKYAVWNNKGGVGKTFLSFVLASEVALQNPERNVILVDMCPQANLSEIVLGGNGTGAAVLGKLLDAGSNRRTIGGYFETRISSPHIITGDETNFLLTASDYNSHMPSNLKILVGDPSLELQAQVISQIGGQTLPDSAWKNVHLWLKDLLQACSRKLGGQPLVFIDCNPSFSAYTELAILAADRIIVPCSSDGSSARAIDNLGMLVYGVGVPTAQVKVYFPGRAKENGLALPLIHSVLLNRSTQYRQEASKAFGAMFLEIKNRSEKLRATRPSVFVNSLVRFAEIPDNHTVSIVCSHLGLPLRSLTPGRYEIHDTSAQVNKETLDLYQSAVAALMVTLDC